MGVLHEKMCKIYTKNVPISKNNINTIICIIYYKMNRVEQMKKIQSEALELFTKKNIDYGDAFSKYGVIGVLMRIEDKLQRSVYNKKRCKFSKR